MIYIGNKEPTPYVGNKAVEYIYIGDKLYYSAIKAHTVTYYVDTSVIYSEDVNKGDSCLSPTSFTPSKSGYVFVGWREDNIASSEILSEKFMGDDPITLYAVFKKTITLSYNGNGATSGSTASQTNTQYYNNGNTANPTFILSANGFGKTGYNFSKWAMGSASGTQYSAGASVTISSDTVFYAVWTSKSGTVTKAYTVGKTASGDGTVREFSATTTLGAWSGVDTEIFSTPNTKTYRLTLKIPVSSIKFSMVASAWRGSYNTDKYLWLCVSKNGAETKVVYWQNGNNPGAGDRPNNSTIPAWSYTFTNLKAGDYITLLYATDCSDANMWFSSATFTYKV